MSDKWVIVDIDERVICGYASNDPIEGWIFTILPEQAAVFDTQLEALRVISTHYVKYTWFDSLHAVPVPHNPRHMVIGERR